MSEILDSIIIDLKVIQNVPVKGRLCTSSHGHLKLEIEGKYATVKRTLNGDSRNRLINRLKSLTSQCTEISDNIISSLYFTRHYERDRMSMFQINENSKKCHQLRKLSSELGRCEDGLQNLKNTYGEDVRINAELEQIADKFKEQIIKIEKALKLIDEEEKKLLGLSEDTSTQPTQPTQSIQSTQPTQSIQPNQSYTSHYEDTNRQSLNDSSISIDPFDQ